MVANQAPDVDKWGRRRRYGKINVPPSIFAQAAIRIPVAGAILPFSLKERRHLQRVYDTPASHTLYIFGRQSEKTTTLGNLAIAYTALINNFKVLMTYPSAMQAKAFAEDRLAIPISLSPRLKPLFPSLKQSVFHKRTIVGSSIVMRYAYLSAARILGLSADMVMIDELQDILPEHIPLIEQATFHSDYKLYRYSGTARTEENTINTYWEQYSTKCEWVVPCRRHGTPKTGGSWHWNVLTAKNIGDTCVICDKCGKPIDPADPDAQWASLQPAKGREDRIAWEGYRVPQLMLPFMKRARDWKDMKRKQREYPINRFYNEVLAISYSSGVQPITKKELKAISNNELKLADFEKWMKLTNGHLYAGIDWGEGTGYSFTVLVVGGYIPPSNKFKIMWMYRFIGEETDPTIYLPMIIEFLREQGVQHIGTDYGGGFFPNNILQKEFGGRRVHQYQYVPRQRTGKVVFNEKMNRYIVSRSEVIADLLTAMKTGLIELPNWDDIDPEYSQDLTALRQVYNYKLRYMQYEKAGARSDDFFHAILYCLLASFFDRRRPDIIAPRPADEIGEDINALYELEMEAYGAA